MKSFMLLSCFLISTLASNAMAETRSDPCTGAGVAPNSWLVRVNDGDQSTREDLLEALALMSTSGFSPSQMTRANEDERSVIIHLTFNETYFSSRSEGRKIKENVLLQLRLLSGMKIYCDYIMQPNPRIGVGN